MARARITQKKREIVSSMRFNLAKNPALLDNVLVHTVEKPAAVNKSDKFDLLWEQFKASLK